MNLLSVSRKAFGNVCDFLSVESILQLRQKILAHCFKLQMWPNKWTFIPPTAISPSPQSIDAQLDELGTVSRASTEVEPSGALTMKYSPALHESVSVDLNSRPLPTRAGHSRTLDLRRTARVEDVSVIAAA
ncbi:hypothetical protein PRIPAC_76465 [Pristionchus pacificus]|uniref:Uncharacterized protein n=1 Tax=Pristionchus pacificus TaxID=54126 RepID=A0A2A6C8M0_PRIPA|nr:hypothetical protein PRIPAC_76465 [Pristionchus pacificus]|eukprot:PDM74555.1 hypothetical protein PRIPAC_41911 [Pristionchus pacificus]